MLLGQWNTRRQKEVTPARKVPYKELDNDVARCTQAIAVQAGQTEYQARGEAYKRKAMMAAAKNDVAMHESCIRSALHDYSQSLSQGDSGQLSKVEWFVQRGVLHKELATTLPPGLLRKHHLTEALTDFSNALHISHNTADVLTLRGDVRCSLGVYESAIDDYTTALPSASPEGKINALKGRSDAWLSVKEVQNAYNDMSQAIHVCTTQEAIDQDSLSELLYLRAKIANTMNRRTQCLQDVGKALELQPNFRSALETRAVLCYSFGMYQEANKDLCDALKLGGEDSEVLSELYRKLKCTQTVHLHIKSGRDLTLPSDTRRKDCYVTYTVRGAGGGVKPVVEGRTLCSITQAWDEVVHFEIPGRGYCIDLTVRDEHPQADTPFLGRASIDLSVDPESGSRWLPLHSIMSRRGDVRLFNVMTGGKGMLNVEWRMRPRLEGETLSFGSTSANTTGLLTDGDEISEVFKRQDTTNRGWLSRAEVKQIYMKFDTFGLPTDDVDVILNKTKDPHDDKVSLDEFTVLMLKIVAR